jgi:hypothetical protein
MGLRYTINNVWMVIFHRPFTRDSKEVRFSKEGTVYRPANPFKEGLIATVLTVIFLVIIAGLAYAVYIAGRALFYW